MTDADIRDLVIRALDAATGMLNRPELARDVLTGGDLDLTRLDIDSLTNLELIMEIEDQLGIDLDADQVAAQVTLNALVAHIAARSGSDAA